MGRCVWILVGAMALARCTGAGAPGGGEDLLADAGVGGGVLADGGDALANGGDVGADGGDALSDGEDVGADGGDSLSDGGDAGADGGDSLTDGGDVGSDGGDSLTDGGDAGSDGGDSLTDGGDAGADGGDSLTDGGDTGSDGGDALTDGGDAGSNGGDALTDGGDAPDIAGPCMADADCDDQDVCTSDSCDGGECVHAFVACDDGSVCTLDGCDPLAGCFVIPTDCDDGDPCTADACSEATSLCLHAPTDCDDGDPCTADACAPGAGCTHDPAPCCATDPDCDDGDPCTVDACAAGACTHAPACCTPDVWSEDFDDGTADGWTFAGQGAAGWSVAPPFGPATSPALWFGDPASGGFDVGTSSGDATTPSFLVPPGVETVATVRLLVDAEPGMQSDRLTIHALAPGGAVLLWTKAKLPSTQAWHEVPVSLSAFGGAQIRLRLRFDTVDAIGNQGLGVLVDDVTIASTCAPQPCVSPVTCSDGHDTTADACIDGLCVHGPPEEPCAPDDTCDDGHPCTDDACEDGFCAHAPVAGCCVNATACWDGDPCSDDLCIGGSPGSCANPPSVTCCLVSAACADGNPCTLDLCPPGGGRCANTWQGGCCADPSDCLDDDPCTDDRCVAGACAHVPACCDLDTDCDDGDPCTEGTCDGGACAFTPTGAAGCCVPLVTTAFPPGEALAPLDDNDPGDGVAWEWTADGCHTPGGCLRAADPLSGTYEGGGLVDVAVATAPFVVAPGTTVSLWVRIANEWTAGYADGPHHDVLSIEALTGDGEATVIWSSDAPKTPWWAAGPEGEMIGPTWVHLVGLPVDDLDGEPVRLVIRFATLDSLLNDFEGPRIDDLVIDACP